MRLLAAIERTLIASRGLLKELHVQALHRKQHDVQLLIADHCIFKALQRLVSELTDNGPYHALGILAALLIYTNRRCIEGFGMSVLNGQTGAAYMLLFLARAACLIDSSGLFG